MKRIEKRVLVLSLSVFMAISTLMGCGGTKETKETDPLKDTDEITVTMMTTEAGTQKFPTDGKLYDLIKEKFNIILEVQPIPASDYETKISTVLASGKMPDIIGGLDSDKMLKYGRTGMFVDLTEYKKLAPDYFDIMYGDDRIDETKKIEMDGKLFGFQKCEYNRIPIASIIAIRKDLLEEQGLKDPTSFEEYYDDLKKIKEIHPDMYGFGTRNGTNYMIGSFAYSLGSGGFPLFQNSRGMYYEPENDAFSYGPTSDKFKKVIEFLNKAYKEGILDPDYATMTKDELFEKLSSGKIMSVYDNNSFVGRVYNPALKEIDAKAKFDIIKPMKNDDGEIRSYRYEKDWPNNISVISSKTEHPERIIELLNWMYTKEGMIATNFGEERKDYTIEDSKIITNQSLIDEAEGASDIAAAVRGNLGLGLQGLAQYVDESLDAQITDPIMLEQGDKITKWTEEGLIDYYPQWPAFNEEEMSKITELESNINNVFNQEIDAFIIGKTPMEEWEDFVDSLKNQGTQQLEKIFNEAYQRAK